MKWFLTPIKKVTSLSPDFCMFFCFRSKDAGQANLYHPGWNRCSCWSHQEELQMEYSHPSGKFQTCTHFFLVFVPTSREFCPENYCFLTRHYIHCASFPTVMGSDIIWKMSIIRHIRQYFTWTWSMSTQDEGTFCARLDKENLRNGNDTCSTKGKQEQAWPSLA